MFRHLITLLVATTCVLALGAGPAAADNAVCIGHLGRHVHGGMAQVTTDWRSDFLGLNQPPGWYAVHIAQARMPDCPPLP